MDSFGVDPLDGAGGHRCDRSQIGEGPVPEGQQPPAEAVVER